MKRQSILIATGNPGKLREIQAVVGDLQVDWSVLADHPPMPEAVEDGATFEENSLKKAEHYAALSGLWVLADDSGLEVDALGGAPGVHSARWAGGGDAANNAKLVEELKGIPDEQRTARFVCCITVVGPETSPITARGTIEGRIIDVPRGKNGFGYDPFFWLPDLQCTSAELDPEHKNRISHRGRALRELSPKLRVVLSSNLC